MSLWNNRLRGPVAAVIEIGLILFTGLLGSLFAEDLRNLDAYLNFFQGRGELQFAMVLFWILFAVTLTFALYRHYQIGLERTRLANEMMDLIRTQPSPDFLGHYDKALNKAYRALYVVRHMEYSSPVAERSVREILKQICIVADRFNPHHNTSDYTANLMLFVGRGEILERSCEEMILQESQRFRATNQGLESTRGVLRIAPNLSYAVDAGGDAPNPRLRVISLPLPEVATRPRENAINEHDVHWFMLPGAPRAWESGRASQMPDTTRIRDWCDENASLPPDLVEKLETYMRKAARKGRFQAFVSLPVWNIATTRTGSHAVPEAKPMAILNIDSHTCGFFGEERPIEEFAILMRPFLEAISELIELLMAHEKSYALQTHTK